MSFSLVSLEVGSHPPALVTNSVPVIWFHLGLDFGILPVLTNLGPTPWRFWFSVEPRGQDVLLPGSDGMQAERENYSEYKHCPQRNPSLGILTLKHSFKKCYFLFTIKIKSIYYFLRVAIEAEQIFSVRVLGP